jgi:transposase InsO family protein
MNQAGETYDNACAESFYSRFKAELLEDGAFEDLAQARVEAFAYIECYYNNTRPHQSLERNSPIPRAVESRRESPVISIPEVGGLHHQYQRAA